MKNAHSNTRVSASIPAQAGVGLKADYYKQALHDAGPANWFEVHPENYMGAGGPPHRYLTAIREQFPLSLHGVGLSIGAPGPLNTHHLNALKNLIQRYEPGLFSEHLAWATHETVFFNDLLPVPYTQETLDLVIAHVAQVQEHVGRQMLLENPSTYIQFESSEMSEIDFITEIAKRSGCGLLLDVNNVFISATNHNYDPFDYLDAFPLQHVGEMHLAGHMTEADDIGAPLLIDTHDRTVADPVWALYEHVIAKAGPIPTLIEWDSDLPTWAILAGEAERANVILDRHRHIQAAE